jgi:hypothetical protein
MIPMDLPLLVALQNVPGKLRCDKNFSDCFIVNWFMMTQQLESYAPQPYASRQYSYTSELLGLKRFIRYENSKPAGSGRTGVSTLIFISECLLN